jgi:2-dehydropantoate 2-reductase
VGATDLVLVFVKSMHTAESIRGARCLASQQTCFVTLQNGLGNAEAIAEIVGVENVVAGVTYRGAKLLGPGHVYETGSGKVFMGELAGESTARLHAIARVFRGAGFEVETTDRVMERIWTKVMINICISAMAAVTGLRTRETAEIAEARRLMRHLLDEAADVAERDGISLPRDQIFATALDVFRAQGDNKASMLVDVEMGRPTEVDSISGAVVRRAEEQGMESPYNRAMTLLVKILEAKGSRSCSGDQ